MTTLTVLDMTQSILSAMDSDEVNSISDTVESMQVARIIQNKYNDIVSRGALPEQEMLIQLTPSNDATKPVLMYVPDGVVTIDWIKYFDSNVNNSQGVSQFGAYSHGVNSDLVVPQNWVTTSTSSVTVGTGTKTFTVASAALPIIIGQSVICQDGAISIIGVATSYVSTTLVIQVTGTSGSGTFSNWVISNNVSSSMPGYKYVSMLPIEQFLTIVNGYSLSDSNVSTFTFTEGGSDFDLYYYINRQPQYCTIIENKYILFDSFDITQDSTLQATKTMAYGTKVSTFELTDNFVPDLDDDKFSLLLNEAKSLAFYELKQMPHSKADQEVKRQWSAVQKGKSVSGKPSYFDQLANFGRVPRTGGFSSGGYGANRWMRGH